MVKLTNPLNKDGILYEKGAILKLTLETEIELIANELAEAYLPKEKGKEEDVEILKEEKAQEENIEEDQKDLQAEEANLLEEIKEEPKDEVKDEEADKETKKASTRIGRTNKK